jgi:hypothetical protein
MDDGKTTAPHNDLDMPRQSAHPCPGCIIENCVRVRVRVPRNRQQVASRSAGKTAAAISGIGAERFLAISHHNVDAGVAHKVNGGCWIRGVGDNIAGANDTIRWNSKAIRLVEQSAGRLKVAVATAEQKQWSADVQHRDG